MTVILALLACAPSTTLCQDKQGIYTGVDENDVSWEITVRAVEADTLGSDYNLDLIGRAFSTEMNAPTYDNLFFDALSGPGLNECANDGNNDVNGWLDSQLDDDDLEELNEDDGWTMTGDWEGAVTNNESLNLSYTMTLVPDTGETVEYSGELELDRTQDVTD